MIPSPEVIEAIRQTENDWYTYTAEDVVYDEPDRLMTREVAGKVSVYAPTGRWQMPTTMAVRVLEYEWRQRYEGKTVREAMPQDYRNHIKLSPQLESIVGRTGTAERGDWRELAIACIDAMFGKPVRITPQLLDVLRRRRDHLEAIVDASETDDPSDGRAYWYHRIYKWLAQLAVTAEES